jgi:hypothetical protein
MPASVGIQFFKMPASMTYKTSFLGLTKKGQSLNGLDENWVFELGNNSPTHLHQ